MFFQSLSFTLLASFVVRLPLSLAQQPTVKTLNGTYAGSFLPTFNQDFFGGIPFAQPAQRLTPARSLNSSFDGIRPALNYSVGCVGIGGDDIGYVQGEDCLTVNVVRPSGVKAGDKLPVMVWIYGGGYTEGSSDNIRYNGSFIVQRSVNMSTPIVFASLNYRLTAYGFLAGQEATNAGILNLGLRDQRLALHWLQENIDAFGGDPTKVTIMGESAGGSSVYQHMLAFNGRNDGLFRGVIAESGYWAPSLAANRTVMYEAAFQALLQRTGCSNLLCLRTIPLERFNASVNAVGAFSFQPVVDGDFITHHPLKQVRSGNFAKVALLAGANSDEGTAFGQRGINTDAQLISAIAARNGSSYAITTQAAVSHILELYPDDPSQGVPVGTGDGVLPTGFQDKRGNAFFGDAVMIGARRAFVEAASKVSNSVFSYRFNQPGFHFPITTGATHFAEVAYVFNNRNSIPSLPSNQPLGPRPRDAELALLMSSMWISFVHGLDPNNNQVANAPSWPAYNKAQQNIVFQGFGGGSFIETDDFRKEGIQFIEDQTAIIAQST